MLFIQKKLQVYKNFLFRTFIQNKLQLQENYEPFRLEKNLNIIIKIFHFPSGVTGARVSWVKPAPGLMGDESKGQNINMVS